jgi:hypothetical protein
VRYEGEEWVNVTRESREVLSIKRYNPALFYYSGKNIPFDKNNPPYNTNLVVAVNSTGKVYLRLRTGNRWGYGEYSEIAELPGVKPPRRVSTPDESVEPQTGDYKVEWEAPDAFGLTIDKYVIEVKTGVGEWKTARDECSKENGSIYRSSYRDLSKSAHYFCKIKMGVLTRKFKLKIGEKIKIRIAAKSFAGLGQWSAKSKRGIRARGPPAKMQPPKENVSKMIRDDVRDIIYV